MASHGKKYAKFGRRKEARAALINGLLKSLIRHNYMSTTETKAKAIRPIVEKLITKVRNFVKASDNLQAIRYIVKNLKLGSPAEKDFFIAKLFDLAKRFQSRPGGYTQIIKNGNRLGDNAPIAYIQFMPENMA